jgi:hypothetical protein
VRLTSAITAAGWQQRDNGGHCLMQLLRAFGCRCLLDVIRSALATPFQLASVLRIPIRGGFITACL